jgi:nicotinamide mononucleotide adenylyltransferase
MASLNTVPYEFFNKDKLVFYFFIGRMNPPHKGHETALKELIRRAMAERSIPLILVGSGPNGGKRTLDNPLTFITKQRILKDLLKDSLCEIREKTNPISDIINWMEEIIRNTHGSEVGEIEVEIKLVTGKKGDNSTKFNNVLTSIKQIAQTKGIIVNETTIPIDAVSQEGEEGVEMSATQVRKDALSALVRGDGSFHRKYTEYYGSQIENVFGEIKQIAEQMPPAQVNEYIETGKLPTARSAKKRVIATPKARSAKTKTVNENVNENTKPSKRKTKKNSGAAANS